MKMTDGEYDALIAELAAGEIVRSMELSLPEEVPLGMMVRDGRVFLPFADMANQIYAMLAFAAGETGEIRLPVTAVAHAIAAARENRIALAGLN